MFFKGFVFFILSNLCFLFGGCESAYRLPVKSTNQHQIKSVEPIINHISDREISDDVISAVAVLDEDTLLATQLTYGNVLRFDKVSKKWISLDTYNSNNWALNSIFFFDKLRGCIVGNYGTRTGRRTLCPLSAASLGALEFLLCHCYADLVVG